MDKQCGREISSIRQRLEFDGLRFLIFLVQQFPLKALKSLATILGSIAYVVDTRGRNVALANISAAFGNEFSTQRKKEIARGSYINFARVMLELFWGPRLTKENFHRYVEIDMPYTPPNRASVYYCLHFGNFEWLSLVGAYVIQPSPIIMQRFQNPSLTRLFQSLRTSTGHEALPQEHAMIRIYKFLRQGGKCGVLTDLNIDPREGAIIIDMFGMKTAVTPFVAVMVKKLSVAVIPSEALPLPNGKWKLKYHPPIEFSSHATTQEITQQCWNILEPSVRKHPELWLWSYKTWRFKPTKGGEHYPFYANTAKRFDRAIQKEKE